jgi:RNA polymerase sigma-70 factor, ECF subfamily
MAVDTESVTEQNGRQRHPIHVQDEKVPPAQQGQVEALEIGRLRSGDRAAAEQLVNEYYQRIYRYIRQLGHNRQTSEDLTQEVFMKAWYHLGQLKEGKALSSWMFRIAHNVSCQHRRAIGRREPTDGERIGVMTEDQTGQRVQDDRVANTEVLQRLQQQVEGLPWILRQTIVLHYLQGFPISAAALVAGVSEGTYKSRLNRALEVLRRATYLG